jgi:hypothetical protein
MSRTEKIRLVVAVALAVGLWQFVRLGTRFVSVHRPGPWDVWIWPWLSGLLVAAPVAALSVATGCLVRPQRPERLAAKLAAIAGFCVLVIPPLLQGLGDGIRGFGADLLAGMYSQALERLIEGFHSWWGGQWPSPAYRVGYDALTLSWYWVVPLAVACWMGANYWRCDSWRSFWRGPGGAILKGALAGGAAGVVLAAPARYYVHSIQTQVAAQGGFILRPLQVGPGLIMSLASLPGAATVTALLVKWRPKPLLGALAGSGLSLGVAAVSRALGPVRPQVFALSQWIALQATYLVAIGVVGAIAGIWAGKWETEPES